MTPAELERLKEIEALHKHSVLPSDMDCAECWLIAQLKAAKDQLAPMTCGHPQVLLEDDQCGKPEHRYCMLCNQIEFSRDSEAYSEELGFELSVARDKLAKAETVMVAVRAFRAVDQSRDQYDGGALVSKLADMFYALDTYDQKGKP